MSHIHIDVEQLKFEYEKNHPVIKGVSFHAREKDAIGLIGANGAGKSTLLKLMVGLDLGFDGTIRVEEIPLGKETLAKVREKIGFVFQDSDSQLFMTTVREDIAFAPTNYGFPKEEVERRVNQAVAAVHIEHLLDKKIFALSGGEKKLVSIATVLSMHPDVLLLDEPSAALDPKNRRNLIRVLNEIDHLKIVSSHDLDFIRETCNRIVLMSDGQIVADGSCEEILTNKELLEANNLELPLSMQ